MRIVYSLMIAGAVLAAQPAQALELTADGLAKLKAGEPVTTFVADKTVSAAGILEAVIDVPTPAPVVWKLLTDCDLNLKVFNGLKSCKILSREADGLGDVREHSIGWSRLLPTVRSVFKSSYESNTLIRFERTEGDLKRLTGEWRLEALPDGGGTRLHYKADIAVGISVPSALIKSALEGDMPKTMKAIRKAAMDGLGG
jgi:carbon monoxide dehydrogenase subunit G